MGKKGVEYRKVVYKIEKSKTSAVLLAVLFGLWAWLYTYKIDSWKFWLNLVLTIVTIGIWGFVAWIWAIVDMSSRPKVFFANYYELNEQLDY